MSNRGYLGRPNKEERIDEELADEAHNLACKLNELLGHSPYNLWRQDEARVIIFNALLQVKQKYAKKGK